MNTAFVLLCATIALALGAPAASQADESALESAAERGDTLTFEAAIARVFAGNPSLTASSAQTTAAREAAAQAGAWINPALTLEAENVGGSYNGIDQSELSLLVTQEFELGGKRTARVSAASALTDAAWFGAHEDTLELRAETRRRYAGVAHAQERVRISRRSIDVVEALAAAAETRVDAGASPVSDRSLAAAALARARLEVAAAEADLGVARGALASLWGGREFPETVVASHAADIPPLPADSASTWAARGPLVTRSRLATRALRADHAVERSLRVPSLSTSLGIRRFEADGANTFLASISLPLPLWDRRAGAVGAARARVSAAESMTQRHLAEATARIAGAITAINRLREQVRTLQSTVAPRLREATDGLRAGYQIGSASYPDLLEVQRALIAVENDVNDDRRDLAVEIATIERLTGRTIEELSHE